MMIRKAKERDLAAIMAIIEATVAIMAAEGNDQWDDNYPTEAVFAQDIAEGALYVYCAASGAIQGVVCLNEEQIAAYETISWLADGPALVVHRLAVDPAARRQGVGTALMRFAEEVARSRNLGEVRTDTYHCNGRMQALFTKLGYQMVGQCTFVEELGLFYCYEKCLADV